MPFKTQLHCPVVYLRKIVSTTFLDSFLHQAAPVSSSFNYVNLVETARSNWKVQWIPFIWSILVSPSSPQRTDRDRSRSFLSPFLFHAESPPSKLSSDLDVLSVLQMYSDKYNTEKLRSRRCLILPKNIVRTLNWEHRKLIKCLRYSLKSASTKGQSVTTEHSFVSRYGSQKTETCIFITEIPLHILNHLTSH